MIEIRKLTIEARVTGDKTSVSPGALPVNTLRSAAEATPSINEIVQLVLDRIKERQENC